MDCYFDVWVLVFLHLCSFLFVFFLYLKRVSYLSFQHWYILHRMIEMNFLLPLFWVTPHALHSGHA